MLRSRQRSKRALGVCGTGSALIALIGPLIACGPLSRAVTIPAERMALASGAGSVQPDNTAPDGRALKIWSNAAAGVGVTAPATVQIDVRARGNQCQGAPVMAVWVDRKPVAMTAVSNATWRTFTFKRALAAGQHRIDIGLVNDHAAGYCDRNLWLDWVQLDKVGAATPSVKPAVTPSNHPTPSPTPTPKPTSTPITTPTSAPPSSAAASNPFSGVSLYVDPNSHAATDATALTSFGDTTDAALLTKIAQQPQADWYGDWIPTGDVASVINARVNTIAAAGDKPVFVIYAIPGRDCGGYSAGGLANGDAYRQWVTQFAAGLAGRPANVILEPDALAQLDCLSSSAQSDRIAMLKDALSILTTSPHTAVYLDAGHAGWQSSGEMVSRLNAAGLPAARGFSLNISAFDATPDEVAYGEAIAEATGKHYVVDTSRNGLGVNGTSCNPDGRALGDRWTTSTGGAHADAYLWIKHPGESDGDCGTGQPAAGTWMVDYAEGLASRAAW